MKNTAIGDRPQISDVWRSELGRFDADMRRRGAAERTRSAYGADLEEFARWATALGLSPSQIGYPILRRYAAALSERRAAPATVARKLASLRAFFRTLVEHGELSANPADLLPGPKRASHLPDVLKPDEVAALLDRIPATTPLELRDRALFELAYACGLRAEELVNLDVTSVDFDAEQVRVLGKGSKTRFVPAGEPALRSVARTSSGRAGPSPRAKGSRPCSLEVRPAPVDVRHPPPPAGLGAARGGPGRGAPARAAPLVRDPPARGRGGPALDPGAARPRLDKHYADLHSGRVSAVEIGLRT
jgi:integrase/recombinase XerC/integrase/recombinase XerD